MSTSVAPLTSEERLGNSLRRSTVVMVDMVGFSDIARSLEEHLSAAAVHDLSLQIQGFFTRALARVADPTAYHVVAKPGDAVLLLFERADDAHCFAYHVHLFAKDHNDRRNEKTAERWFRIGIATGDVLAVTAVAGSSTEYAGIAIANAVRLEAAAGPGEILMDVETFERLSPENQSAYGPEETVSGKRKERFRARRYCVVIRSKIAPLSPHPWLTRRTFIASASVFLSGTVLAVGWFKRFAIGAWMHPLPPKRFVAIIAWPHVADVRLEPTVKAAIDAIGSELARAEAFDRNLSIIPHRIGKEVENMAQINEIRRSIGANLVLCASANTQ